MLLLSHKIRHFQMWMGICKVGMQNVQIIHLMIMQFSQSLTRMAATTVQSSKAAKQHFNNHLAYQILCQIQGAHLWMNIAMMMILGMHLLWVAGSVPRLTHNPLERLLSFRYIRIDIADQDEFFATEVDFVEGGIGSGQYSDSEDDRTENVNALAEAVLQISSRSQPSPNQHGSRSSTSSSQRSSYFSGEVSDEQCPATRSDVFLSRHYIGARMALLKIMLQ